MNTPVQKDDWALTEKEKETLRLIFRGHDAKSIARSLGLSVHTINERLRDARRKMAVSSSREAARLLLAAEQGRPGSSDPQFFGDVKMGGDSPQALIDQGDAPIPGAGRVHRLPWIVIGVLLMTLALSLLALTVLPNAASTAPPAPAAVRAAPNAEVVDTARQWLALVDQGRWDESYRATGTSFRKLNTAEVGASVSEKVRAPLGTVISRALIAQEKVPAPPHGYEVVKFRTSFANKADAVETITLDREEGGWRVVGLTID